MADWSHLPPLLFLIVALIPKTYCRRMSLTRSYKNSHQTIITLPSAIPVRNSALKAYHLHPNRPQTQSQILPVRSVPRFPKVYFVFAFKSGPASRALCIHSNFCRRLTILLFSDRGKLTRTEFFASTGSRRRLD
jgi:hypothetical protein